MYGGHINDNATRMKQPCFPFIFFLPTTITSNGDLGIYVGFEMGGEDDFLTFFTLHLSQKVSRPYTYL